MGLLSRLAGLREKLAQRPEQSAEPEVQPAIDAPYSEHESGKAHPPTMSDADAAGAGFPPEIR